MPRLFLRKLVSRLKDTSFSQQKIRIVEGEPTTFCNTDIVFGILSAYSVGPNLVLTLYSDPLRNICTQRYGMEQWEGFREIGQAMFFYYGGLSSWML